MPPPICSFMPTEAVYPGLMPLTKSVLTSVLLTHAVLRAAMKPTNNCATSFTTKRTSNAVFVPPDFGRSVMDPEDFTPGIQPQQNQPTAFRKESILLFAFRKESILLFAFRKESILLFAFKKQACIISLLYAKINVPGWASSSI